MRSGAGTDANVSVELHGAKGFVGATKLDNNANNFERGRKDEFEVKPLMWEWQVGGRSSRLHRKWLQALRLCIAQSLLMPCRCGPRSASQQRYVHVLPASQACAAVCLVLHLLSSKTLVLYSKHSFNLAVLLLLQVTGSDVGEMTHVVIGHDNTGIGSAWHLAQVEVYHPGLQKTFTFPCNEWLEATKDKGIEGCKRTLKTGALQAAGGADGPGRMLSPALRL